MNIILALFLFITLVLFYLNMTEQYKVGSELEIYEMDYENNFALQRIMKKKQPVLFQMKGIVIPDVHNMHDLALDKYATKYGKERVRIAEQNSIANPVTLSLEKALELLNTDTGTHYLSYSNQDFIQETSMARYMASIDEFLAPSFTISTKYDFIFGSSGAKTNMAKHDAHSGFLYVSRGEITVKMTPLKNQKYFTSQSDLWSPGADVPSLEFQVPEGWALYIPPAWFYSYRLDKAKTHVHTYMYTTVMNIVSKMPLDLKQLVDKYLGSNGSKERDGINGRDLEPRFHTVAPTLERPIHTIPLSSEDDSIPKLTAKQELEDAAQQMQIQKEKNHAQQMLENKPLQPPVIGAQQHEKPLVSSYENQYDHVTPISPLKNDVQEVFQQQIQTDAADFSRKLTN